MWWRPSAVGRTSPPWSAMAERRPAGTTYPPARSLLLCAAPRTGSTLVCDLLTGTGLLGHPKEPFAPVAVAPCREAWGVADPEVDASAYLRAALRNGTSRNGVFSAKVMWDDLAGLQRWLGHIPPEDALATFPDPRLLVIGRRDKVAAAVSWARARATGSWSRSAADPNPSPGVINLAAISAAHDDHHRAEDGWAALVARTSLPHRRIDYEDVLADRRSVVVLAAALAEVEVTGPVPPTDLAVQRDGWSTEATTRWIAATGGCERCAGTTLRMRPGAPPPPAT